MTEMPADQVVVSLDATGQLAINAAKISDADYADKLKRIMAAKATGDRLVFFMADDDTNYGKLITALDGAKQAGAETLGMMTEKPEGPGPTPGAPGAPGETPPTPPAPPTP